MKNITALNNDLALCAESSADHRRELMATYTLPVDLVSALAGDRSLSKTEEVFLSDLRQNRGLGFFSDLLYAVTRQHYPPGTAENLWTEVLRHKHELSTALGRNVKLAVAALDYLANITDNLSHPTLIGEAQIKEIIDCSLRDGLTGLFNHAYFYQQLGAEMRRYRRYGTVFALALIDIDDFKAVNDTYGHREGDRILAAMGETLMLAARASDICCRYGGEELAVILPSTEVHEAGVIANRLKIKLAKYLPNDQPVTVSIGVSVCGKTTGTHQDLVERADAALYKVKRSGKNHVVVAADKAWAIGSAKEHKHPVPPMTRNDAEFYGSILNAGAGDDR